MVCARWIELMKKWRSEGYPYRIIGEAVGVSTERARQILKREESRAKNGDSQTMENALSTRVRNILHNNGITSKDDLQKFLASGERLRDLRNFGKRMELEVLNWLSGSK